MPTLNSHEYSQGHQIFQVERVINYLRCIYHTVRIQDTTKKSKINYIFTLGIECIILFTCIILWLITHVDSYLYFNAENYLCPALCSYYLSRKRGWKKH